ncbi:DUF4253 domain-containing protein [Micromonospora sp. NPDC005299]|uniref:DUF4253 domain-containing protein n=1 Tax=Micromonospora sp. NPDC005299 TaxID=3364231 RepID=UPI0036A79E67
MTAPEWDLRTIAAALHGTVLEDHPVEEGIGGTVIVDEVDPSRLLEAWRAARAVTPTTGRCPVFTLPGDLHHEPTPAEIDDLARAARAIDPWAAFRRHRDDRPMEPWRIESYVSAFLGAERLPLAAGPLAAPTSEPELDRWLYDTLLADPVLADLARGWYEPLVGTRTWHPMREVQLVLLPTTSPWLAPAWVGYFGAIFPGGPEAWAAAMRQWHRHWGAELVAAFSTTLQFVVSRQPQPGPPAWELAGQLLAVGGSLQHEQWQLAMAVARSDAWFLHDRP